MFYKKIFEAKAQLEHGQWGKWLEEKVDFSDATAQRFMKAASEFSNSSTLRSLSQSKVFALLSLPQEDRDTFISTPLQVKDTQKTIEEMTIQTFNLRYK